MMGHSFFWSTLLFIISILGMVVNRKNIVTILMCLELMLLAVNWQWVAISHGLSDLKGQVFVFFVLTVAAAEAAIGLAIAVCVFRQRGSIALDDCATMKG